VRKSQLSFIPDKGYFEHRQHGEPIGLQPAIVCCIKFRLIESFKQHCHTENHAATPPVPMNSHAVPINFKGLLTAEICGSWDAESGV